MTLTADELAARSGVAPADVRRLVDLGLLSERDPGRYDEAVIPRVRLAAALEGSGISLADVADAVRKTNLSLSFADRLFGRPSGVLSISGRQLASELAVSGDLVDEIQTSLGIDPEEPALEQDAEILRTLDRLISLGLDEQVAARFFYVIVENMRRVAQAGREMWRVGVEEPLLAAGLSHAEMLEAEAGPAPESQLLGERLVTLLWNRFIGDEIYQAAVVLLEKALTEAGVTRDREATPPAIAFLDLTGFTGLTERSGDEAASHFARRLVDVLRPSAGRHRGRLVKMLGDGAMVHFAASGDAVRFALEVVESVAAAGLAPARVAINSGPVLLRDADFFGGTVNVAARLLDYARPREVLVAATVAEQVDDPGVEFREVGPASLKGVQAPVLVYSAHHVPSASQSR
ncbi:MAG TPA: adenylate/guanylate cyclase domain-containing protein [Acidimicrobiia bacterium]|nr:adenylate/guanylate cyclase domain-containing protein [Acidimicrobiia bacterium]